MARSDPIISPTGEWVILKIRIEERIEKLRDDLEQYGAGEQIRGEIAGLRWLIGEVEVEEVSDDAQQAAERPTAAGGY